MAQLVKIQDYVSRYQIDLARYPTQFVRLKKVQWERIRTQWEKGEMINQQWEHIDLAEGKELNEKGRLPFWKRLLTFRRAEQYQEAEAEVETDFFKDGEEILPDESTTLYFEPNIVYSPQTVGDLKRMFIDQFFHFQIKWASSTLREKSYVDPKYMRDTLLRYFIQRLPDNYLVFYYPILRIKKAPIELEVIIITPVECICITVLEEEDNAAYIGGSERFWVKKVGKEDRKTLNPFIRLNRTEKILSDLFDEHRIELPIQKVLLSRNGYIDYPVTITATQMIDKRHFDEWSQQLSKTTSPMKHMQIQAAQKILATAQTTSFNRDIWTTGNDQAD